MKVFLNVGGRYINYWCKNWVNRFRNHLKKREIETIEIDISKEEDRGFIKKNHKQNDLFISRFSEHRFPGWVTHYKEIAPLFGDRMYPNAKEVYYYNDKNRQRILFEEMGYPHPKTIYAKSSEDLERELSTGRLELPLVRKAIKGSSSRYVSLKTSAEGIKFPCLLQEFCDGNDGDITTIVVGDEVTGYKRFNMDNDFRASGSHKNCYLASEPPMYKEDGASLFATPSCIQELPLECLKMSCKISKDNGFNSMVYDFVKNNKGEWVVLEISYTTVPSYVNACEWKYNSANNFEKIKNDCSVQELIIRRMLDE